MIKEMIIAAALTTTFAMTASASIVTTKTVSVPFSQSAVESDLAQTVMMNRLKRAAKQVCGTTHRADAGSLTQAMKNRACYQESLDAALSDAGLNASNNS